MKSIIISDIHNKWRIAQDIIDYEKDADWRFFLGDIYDNFGDTLEDIEATAKWHKLALNDPKNVFLFGNHDIFYRFPNNYALRCSGNTRDKAQVINSVLTIFDWAKTQLYTEVDGWLLSHAGVDRPYTDLAKTCRDALAQAEAGLVPPLLNAGWARGGPLPTGGILWQDFNLEFEPVDRLKQIVGHTPQKEPRQKGGNWCLDTHLNHFGILEDGELTIKEVSSKLRVD